MSFFKAGQLQQVVPAVAAVVALGVVGVSTADHGGRGPAKRARSVILINGDGMASAHREAARLHLKGLDGQLEMDSLPVAGLETTSPHDPEATVTDSAAAATAWATGQKTYNGAISVDVDGTSLPALGAEARAAGKATGLVTTAQVTDATPAAFFSSTPDRGAQDEIARQYLQVSKPDVILGGGEDWWLPTGTPGAFQDAPADDPTEGSRGTRGDLVSEAQGLGYDYVSSAAGLEASRSRKLLGLFSNEEMFQQRPEGQGDEYDPLVPLPDMAAKALDTLSKDRDGFFLLLEEEGVDEMAHDNNAARVLQAMDQLDRTVAVARAYVAEHPDTLLVVTGDHECGGLTVEDVDPDDESGPGGTTYGPDGEVSVPAVYDEGRSGEDGPFSVAGSDHTFVMDWTTTAHTGAPTPVTAVGPGSAALTGVYPNTHLHEVMRSVLLGGRS